MKKVGVVFLVILIGFGSYMILDASFDWGLWRLVTQLQKASSEFGKIEDKKVTLEANFNTHSIGSLAPEIHLPDGQGNTIKLSDFRQKYVMIDFWASWCFNCRQKNPDFLRIYQKYKSKGFEIIAISLDRERKDWLRAIEEDGFSWTNVCDFNGIDSEVATLYGVSATPTTYLIDPQGKIIAKDLDSHELDKKLAELLGS